jgi:preprotein translocase subunit SecA
MDDELMRLFGGDKMKSIMARIGMTGGEPIFHPMLNRSIENAQKKVEERNFEIRKHLLEYDDVLNSQRKFIYDQRDAILVDQDLKNRVNDATATFTEDFIDEYTANSKRDLNAALNRLSENLKTKFGYNLSVQKGDNINSDVLEKRIIADLEKDLDDKEVLIGHEYLNLIIRDNYLHFVDRKWLDHLENMEALRKAKNQRNKTQKNPLVEYKLEGFRMFEKMIEEIRQEIASRLHLIRIQITNEPRRPINRSIGTIQSASHNSMGAFSGSPAAAPSPAASPLAKASRPENATVVRTHPKIGRNDPCPCGSGKKYKQCHGG